MVCVVDLSMVLVPTVRTYLCVGMGFIGLCLCMSVRYK